MGATMVLYSETARGGTGAVLRPRRRQNERVSDMAKKNGSGKQKDRSNNAPVENVTEQTNMSEQQIEQPEQNDGADQIEAPEQIEQTTADQKDGKKGKRKIIPLAATDERIPEGLREHVEAGVLVAAVGEVGANANGKTASAPYLRLRAKSVEMAMLLSGGRLLKEAAAETDDDDDDENDRGMLDHFNYAFDLFVRGKIRNTLLQGLEGPDKAIERAVKGMLGTGLDRAEAIELVVSSMKRKGKLPADYVFAE